MLWKVERYHRTGIHFNGVRMLHVVAACGVDARVCELTWMLLVFRGLDSTLVMLGGRFVGSHFGLS